jgi:hypothetical protein
MSTPHIDELRTELLATLRDLRNRENPMEPDRAKAVAQVAGVLVDSARVEVEYLRATEGNSSAFLERTSANDTPPPLPRVITHKLK